MANDSNKEFQCHSRRHMSGAVYKTYETMRVIAHSKAAQEKHIEGTPWIFTAAIKPTLCNYTNTAKTQIEAHIKWLLKNRWLTEVSPGVRKRWPDSWRLAPVEYIILDHD